MLGQHRLLIKVLEKLLLPRKTFRIMIGVYKRRGKSWASILGLLISAK